MGLLDRLKSRFSRKEPTVGAKMFALAAMGLAEGHVSALRERFQELPEDLWGPVLAETYRAYFAVASLVAGAHFNDDESLNRFGARMLEVLADPREVPEAVAEAFSDEGAVAYAVEAYCHGRPTEEDATASAQWRRLLKVPDHSGTILTICALLHSRVCRQLGASQSELRQFMLAWLVNGSYLPGGVREVLRPLRPVL